MAVDRASLPGDINSIGSKGYYDWVMKSTPEDARAYGERYSYSPQQLANFYNVGAGYKSSDPNFITGNQAAKNLGVSSPSNPLGNYAKSRNQKTGAYEAGFLPSDDANFSGWTPGADYERADNGITINRSTPGATTTPSYTGSPSGGGNMNPSPAPKTSYTAQERETDPGTMTVAGRTAGLLESDAPWIQSARTRGLQLANERGLLDSTMALGEAEKQAYDAVIPVATADAGTYFQQQQINQNAVNQARATNAGLLQETNLFNTDFRNQRALRDQDTENVLRVNAAETKNQMRTNAQQNAAALKQIGLQNLGDMNLQELRNSGALEQLNIQSASDRELQDIIDEAAMERLNISEQGTIDRNQATIDSNEAIAQANRDFNLDIQADRFSQDDKISFGSFLKDTSQQYLIQRTNIALDPNLSGPEKTRALQDLENTHMSDIQAMADLYNVDISLTELGVESEGTPGSMSNPWNTWRNTSGQYIP